MGVTCFSRLVIGVLSSSTGRLAGDANGHCRPSCGIQADAGLLLHPPALFGLDVRLS